MEQRISEAVIFKFFIGFSFVVWVEELVSVVESGGFDYFANSEVYASGNKVVFIYA